MPPSPTFSRTWNRPSMRPVRLSDSAILPGCYHTVRLHLTERVHQHGDALFHAIRAALRLAVQFARLADRPRIDGPNDTAFFVEHMQRGDRMRFHITHGVALLALH